LALRHHHPSHRRLPKNDDSSPLDGYQLQLHQCLRQQQQRQQTSGFKQKQSCAEINKWQLQTSTQLGLFRTLQSEARLNSTPWRRLTSLQNRKKPHQFHSSRLRQPHSSQRHQRQLKDLLLRPPGALHLLQQVQHSEPLRVPHLLELVWCQD
jgi:hypothetical protein